MRTTISRRKSRTRPSCTCERVTCLGRTRVMRLPDSAKCRRSVDVATDMYNTHVSAHVREYWSHDVVRNELSLLPLSWRPSGLPKSCGVWFMRTRDQEGAAARRSQLENGPESFMNVPRRKRNGKRNDQVSFTPTPLECFSVLRHTCNYDLNVFRGLCGGSSLAIVYAARKRLLDKDSYANVQFTCLAANHYRHKWFLRCDYCITTVIAKKSLKPDTFHDINLTHN